MRRRYVWAQCGAKWPFSGIVGVVGVSVACGLRLSAARAWVEPYPHGCDLTSTKCMVADYNFDCDYYVCESYACECLDGFKTDPLSQQSCLFGVDRHVREEMHRQM